MPAVLLPLILVSISVPFASRFYIEHRSYEHCIIQRGRYYDFLCLLGPLFQNHDFFQAFL